MTVIGTRPVETSRGKEFVRLFKLDVHPFKLLGQKHCPDRDLGRLDKPYELSDLMRQAIEAGVWPRRY